jgi:Bleomycin resistance protein-like N-terminal
MSTASVRSSACQDRSLFSRGLREVVLIVDDVEASTVFYRDVVGLELREPQTSDWAWFLVEIYACVDA